MKYRCLPILVASCLLLTACNGGTNQSNPSSAQTTQVVAISDTAESETLQTIVLPDNNQLQLALPHNFDNVQLDKNSFITIRAKLNNDTSAMLPFTFKITNAGKNTTDEFSISSFSSDSKNLSNGSSSAGCNLMTKENQCIILIKINEKRSNNYNLEVYNKEELVKTIPFTTTAASQLKSYLPAEQLPTKTPIKHLIILVEENEAFDKMFGTYPYAANPQDESSPRFYGIVGNKVPNNYLMVDHNGYPLDAQGAEIHQFTPDTRPQFNAILNNNPNGINPYRLNYNDYMCASSHQYNEELWAYGVLKFGSNQLGDLKADKFLKYSGAGIGGDIVQNHLANISKIEKTDSPFYRDVFGWACLSPSDNMRNIYNAAGNPDSTHSISSNLELMQGTGLIAGTILDPIGKYNPQGRKYYSQRFGQTMGYWDGNSTQALWNYAQHFTISDNFHQLTYGPSVLGHLSHIYGATGPLDTRYTTNSSLFINSLIGFVTKDGKGNYFMEENLNPVLDVCSNPNITSNTNDETSTSAVLMQTRNIGNLLSEYQISWGWFAGGFRNKVDNNCTETGYNQFGTNITTFQSAVEPFQFSAATANPFHLPPQQGDLIGGEGQANHQYDLSDFVTALNQDKLPAVVYLKAKNYQNGHGYTSSPGDEQNWLVNVMNKIQQSKAYGRGDTAIIITEDDSDGGYDHVIEPPHRTYNNNTMYGLGPRLAFVLISPYAKHNYVDSTLTDQTSILRFIKYNWNLGEQLINDYSEENNSGTLQNMFDFSQSASIKPELLYCDGSPYDNSTNTPAPILTTFNGPVTQHPDNSIDEYLNQKIPAGSHGLIENDFNKLIRKTGYEVSPGHYECANQFGY